MKKDLINDKDQEINQTFKLNNQEDEIIVEEGANLDFETVEMDISGKKINGITQHNSKENPSSSIIIKRGDPEDNRLMPNLFFETFYGDKHEKKNWTY